MLKHLPGLIKYKLSLAVTVTCFSGYFLFHKDLDLKLLITSLSVYFLAGGMSAFNQYQERKRDSVMKRTMGRPIPTGSISLRSALIVSLIFITLGLTGLIIISIDVLLLGLTSIVLYNYLYTGLKSITYLSIIPGALVGSIPPLIGWVSAGGEIISKQILYLGFLIFMWQIPHFWILILRYRQDYKSAGYPTILDKIPEAQLRRIVFIWISFSCLFILAWPLFDIHLISIIRYALILSVLMFISIFYYFTFMIRKINRAFIISNVFIILLFLIFASGSIPEIIQNPSL